MTESTLRLCIRLAWAGVVLQIVGTGIAIAAFTSGASGGYSPLNHFVSELTSPTLSPKAGVMSAALALGSLLSLPALGALAQVIGGRLARVALVCAVVSSGAVVALAFAPMENLGPHLHAALVFFWSWLLTVFFFGLALLRRFSFRAAPVLCLASAFSLLASAAFLTILTTAGILSGVKSIQLEPRQILEWLRTAPRPAVWEVAVLEWRVVLFVFIWVISALRFLEKTARSTAPKLP